MAMSRLDWITAVIVVICVAALGFLIYKTVGLMDTEDPVNPTENVITDSALEDDAAIDATGENKDTIIDSDIRYDDDATTEDDDDEAEEDAEGQGKDEEMEDDDDSKYIAEENISGAYLVIAGSYKQMINAENQVRRLKRKGYDSARVAMFNKGAYAVAFVKAFDHFGAADDLATTLKDSGIEAAVHKKR